MKNSTHNRHSERGAATAKFLVILVFIVLLANAGYNYVPVAYQGASFRQEMDTAVVKGLSASGNLKPLEVIKAHLQKAAFDYNIPTDALIDVNATAGHIQAHAEYKKKVDILPFGIYKYNYDFSYTATPQGYLLKDK